MDRRTVGLRAALVGFLVYATWCGVVQPAAAQPAAQPPLAAPAQPTTPQVPMQPDDLFRLDIERLGQVPVVLSTSAAPISLQLQVSSVSRQESTVAHSPAAIFVITQDMICRSGATSLPQLFRMVPGMDVARVDSSRWAISILRRIKRLEPSICALAWSK